MEELCEKELDEIVGSMNKVRDMALWKNFSDSDLIGGLLVTIMAMRMDMQCMSNDMSCLLTELSDRGFIDKKNGNNGKRIIG